MIESQFTQKGRVIGESRHVLVTAGLDNREIKLLTFFFINYLSIWFEHMIEWGLIKLVVVSLNWSTVTLSFFPMGSTTEQTNMGLIQFFVVITRRCVECNNWLGRDSMGWVWAACWAFSPPSALLWQWRSLDKGSYSTWGNFYGTWLYQP